MKNNPVKGYRLNYEVTDRKLRAAAIRVIESGKDPTVRLVAKEAGVSMSAAYAHKCQDMILDVLFEK